MGKDVTATLTLRTPVRFWRNSVLLSFLSVPLCVAAPLHPLFLSLPPASLHPSSS